MNKKPTVPVPVGQPIDIIFYGNFFPRIEDFLVTLEASSQTNK
jgi:hypothetical protein